MINSIKARTPVLALILFVFAIGYTFAEKVVVIPLAGDVGISGYEIVINTVEINPSSQAEYYVGVDCPAGKKVLGGGGRPFGNTFVIAESSPRENHGWGVSWYELVDSTTPANVNVFAICAKVG